jgi:hypothetical protein
MGMSINPFERRLQERREQEIQPSDVQVDEQIEVEEPKKNPFEERLKKKEDLSNSLWAGFMDMLTSEEETPFEEGLGQTLRGMGTAVAGLPGDIIQLSKAAGEWMESKFPTPSFLKRDPNVLQKKLKDIAESVPTTEDLQEKFDVLTEGRYMPQSEKEAFMQELAGDIGTFLLPAKEAKTALKSVGVAIGGNLAKEGMKELGFGEPTQSGTKLASFMFLSAFNPKGAKKHVSGLYDQAFAVKPKTSVMSAKEFQKDILNLRKDLTKGIPSVESKKPVLDSLKQIEDNIKKGKVQLGDLVDAKIDLNEVRAAKIYDPEFKGTKKVRERLKKNFSKASKVLDDAVLRFGEDSPEFKRLFKDAQLGWGGIEQSRKGTEFLKRVAKKHKLVLGPSGITLSHYFPAAGLGTAATGVVGVGGLKSYELMHRVLNNKVLRKHYFDTLLGAVNESTPTVIRELKKLDKEIKKQDEKLRKEPNRRL